jgi:hypothetical protein
MGGDAQVAVTCAPGRAAGAALCCAVLRLTPSCVLANNHIEQRLIND